MTSSPFANMTLEEQVGQMFMAGFDGLAPPDYILDWLRQGQIGGVILFARNVESPSQLAELTAVCHAAAPRPILIGIDQEGGAVARLREAFTESPGAMAIAAAQDNVSLAEDMSALLAAELRALGINWNYAPVVDVAYNPDNPSLGTRAFSDDSAAVAELAAASVRGFQREGVAACAKHFPGLGDTAIDTHLALPTIDTSRAHLEDNDLPPYRAVINAGVASVMTTHTIFTAMDSKHPATLSSRIIPELLRDGLGFDGIVTSDCMEMQAITDHYGAGESAVLGALAGLDLILISHTRERQEAAYDALLNAVRTGNVPSSRIAEAARRIAAMKTAYPAAASADLSVIRSAAHLARAERAARAGVALIQDNPAIFPLKPHNDRKIGLVEFASYLDSDVMERGNAAGFAARLKADAPEIEAVALKSVDPDPAAVQRAESLAKDSDLLVLAVRSAHLNPTQFTTAGRLLTMAQQTILVCLRSPYDAVALHGADAILCTLSDSAPSLDAAVAALMGAFEPTGQLPVSLERWKNPHFTD